MQAELAISPEQLVTPPDAGKLVGWLVPDVRHAYTARDTAFYALSVGVGHDPSNARQRELVDPWNPQLKALPTMALVLAYPGFWLGDDKVLQETGIRASQVLHAEQSIELAGPLPVAADILGRTKVTGVKARGADALLYSERTIEDARTGTVLAVCRQTHFLRGASPAHDVGVPVAGRPWTEPVGTPSQVSLATRPEQALLYRLNGDANLLHIEPDFARAAGLPHPILHGMASIGVLCHALVASLMGYDPSRIRQLSLRMKRPVYPGDKLSTTVWPDGSFHAVVSDRNEVVIDNGFCSFE